ncbi:deoxyguanosinetriphosphate triphosphohydrolase [Thermoproteota archaeon]
MINYFNKIALAPYAMKEELSRGREHEDSKTHPYRSIYQRDRDRIIHSAAFRRLEYKTQVFVYNEGDYYRTRLTHTIEVSQIARTIANVLGLNEYLVEAIALAHDLGHPPFGHEGEEELNKLMRNHGGFNHNIQTLRTVELLEQRYPKFRGLNLTWETREGIAKHNTTYDKIVAKKIERFEPKKLPTLEAQVVDLADEIAYNNHDLDDGLTSKLINESDLEKLQLWKKANNHIQKNYGNISEKMRKYQHIRFLINYLVNDVITQSQKNLARLKINSVDDARNAKQKTIAFSDDVRSKLVPLRSFLLDKFYHHYRVVRMANKARRFIGDLFEIFTKNTKALPNDFQKHIKTKEDQYLIVCDYISGMTDRYALNEHKKLFDPYEKV